MNKHLDEAFGFRVFECLAPPEVPEALGRVHGIFNNVDLELKWKLNQLIEDITDEYLSSLTDAEHHNNFDLHEKRLGTFLSKLDQIIHDLTDGFYYSPTDVDCDENADIRKKIWEIFME